MTMLALIAYAGAGTGVIIITIMLPPYVEICDVFIICLILSGSSSNFFPTDLYGYLILTF
jgi:hypothetical protein